MGIITALCPHIGYARASALAKEALNRNIPIRQLILSRKILTEEQMDAVLDIHKMTQPGIIGREHHQK